MIPSNAVLRFTDPGEYQRALQGADIKLTLTAPGKFEAELTRINFQNVWMQRARMSLPSVTHSRVHKGRSMVFFLLDEDQPPILNSGLEVSPADILFYAPESAHHYRTLSSYRCGGLSMSPAFFATVSKALAGRELAAPATSSLFRPPPASMARLRNLHSAAADLAINAPDILAQPEVARALEDELVRAVISSLTEGERVTEEREGRVPVMQRFEQVLEAHASEPVYLMDLCAEIGVSDRTLRRYCEEHLGMSPQRYLWLRRMNMARRALFRAEETRATVTLIATEHGFGELGRFSVQYRKLFGELPSATLRRRPDDPQPSPDIMIEKVAFPILP